MRDFSKELIVKTSVSTTVKGKNIFIPEDATNGDVIKAMFPDASIYEGHGYGYVYSDVVRIPENYMMTYDINWWNAKYKEVSE